jgi:hypothetical protein
VTALARIIRAREALEDGDVAYAAAILSDLEDDLAAEEPEQLFRFACSRCSVRFRWPGELDHHQRFTHFAEAA